MWFHKILDTIFEVVLLVNMVYLGGNDLLSLEFNIYKTL